MTSNSRRHLQENKKPPKLAAARHLIIRSCLSDRVSRLSQNSPHPIHLRIFGHPTILTFTMICPPARITHYIIVTGAIFYPKREPEQNTVINKNAKSSEAGPKHPKIAKSVCRHKVVGSQKSRITLNDQSSQLWIWIKSLQCHKMKVSSVGWISQLVSHVSASQVTK